MKQLIVNADDLGMSEGVTKGILEAHLEGMVTSSTVMITMPAARASIKLAQQEAPQLGLGLHFNLTYGKPLLNAKEITSLVRSDGSFVSVTRGLGMHHHWQSKDIKAEFKAQLECFADYAGCLPDHLDSHQLIGSLSAECREVMLDIAEAYALPVRQGGHYLYKQFQRVFETWGVVPKVIAPTLFNRYPFKRHEHIFQRQVTSPDHFNFDFHDKKATVETLFKILETLASGVTELVCHPGYSGGEADAYPYREQELAALKNKQLTEKLTESNIELVNFSTYEKLRFGVK